MIQRAGLAGMVGSHLQFELELRPKIYALMHRADHRMFQEQSIPDVVRTIFTETGVSNVEYRLNRTHGKREMLVQYGETTLDFVSRLLEEAGIFYYFIHSADGHQLVLCDGIDGFEQGASCPILSLSPQQGDFAEPLSRFSRRRRLATTSVRLRDFDFEQPGVCPEGNATAKDAQPRPYFEYPARAIVPSELDDLAKVRLAELRARADVCEGDTSSILLEVGHGCSVIGSQHDELDGDYIIASLRTTGRQFDSTGLENVVCTCRFEGIPLGTAYAPPRTTPKPRIAGHQTAFITGDDAADQAIHTDRYGRVRLHFHWDRVNQRDANSSPWIRVSQIMLGGTIVIPRVGWEASVSFFEGDPDRPLVLGRLYNTEAAPPMALPGEMASSCLESMSSPGGAGSNKISMNDSGDSQGYGISAQRDLNVTIGNDCSVDIGVDDAHDIGSNLSRTVTEDETTKVEGNQEISVGANQSFKIGGSQTIGVDGDDTSNATGNLLEKVAGSRNYSIDGTSILVCNGVRREITGNFTRKSEAVQVVVSGDSISDNVMTGCTSTVGAVRMHVSGGNHGETVGGAKSELETAAAVHMTQTDYTTEAGSTLAYTVGGIHMRKIVQDYTVKAPVIALVGGNGQLKVGSSKIALAGGPISLKASNVSVEAALVTRTGGTIKFA